MGGDNRRGAVRPAPEWHGARYLGSDGTSGTDESVWTVPFSFDGEQFVGREGELLLAALLAAGVRVLRTMPKSGEARGGYCLVGRCTDCLVVVDGEPNVRACLRPLAPGMRVEPQVGLSPLPSSGGSVGSRQDFDWPAE